ncbi:MAG: tRNA lysidine(34) synthetase TilS [Deltaproteobacteria bacterium]|uniref:tRNA(Ile)-lysidine synthase n=1 Tax=Candidatus Zymogenus saltonus TaxID=2844893 RepID=A0A9D8KDX2_9DELT|nr:tRNA lysidine(34) synthetase TilS [Candidatus Zymogenus saltonus]
MKKRFLKKVSDAIDTHGMIDSGDHVVCAVSGGADSTALLYALYYLRGKYDITISAAHVNHGLRGEEARRDQNHARRLAEDLGLEFHLKDADVKGYASIGRLSVQEAGREVRDAFFREIVERYGGAKVATGHTKTDNGETYLMRLIVGAGLEGLSGIPPINGFYIRPLIAVSRGEAEEFLDEIGVDYVTDSSNLENKYLRNIIRNEIIPILREVNPNVEESLAETAAEYRRLFETVREEVNAFMEKNLEGNSLPVDALNSLPEGLKGEAVKELIFRNAEDMEKPLRLTRRHIEAVLGIVRGISRGERAVDLPGGLTAVRSYGRLSVVKAGRSGEGTDAVYSIEIPGRTEIPRLNLKIVSAVETGAETDIGDDKNPVIFDMDRLKSPLTLRTRRDGDRFYPAGMKGSKKVKDFFIDIKIPRSKRDKVPILLSGGDIIWIVGHRADGRFVANEGTKRRLKINFSPLS